MVGKARELAIRQELARDLLHVMCPHEVRSDARTDRKLDFRKILCKDLKDGGSMQARGTLAHGLFILIRRDLPRTES